MNKKTKNKLTALVLAALAVGGTPVYAAENQENVEAREVVVTATRTEQDVKDAPASIKVITAKEIEQKGAVTLRQALESVMNISLDIDGMGRNNVSMRGMEPRHTLILIDGRRLTGETGLSAAGAYDIDRIRLDNVDRIEIVRGSASALYGTDAMGGVINIITKQPQKPQWDLQYQGSMYNGSSGAGKNWSLRYDAGKTGNFGWSMSAGVKEEKPYTMANGTNNNWYGDRKPFNFKGVWDLSKSEKLTFDYDYLKEEIEKKELSSGSLRRAINNNDRSNYSIGYEAKGDQSDFQFRAYKSIYNKDYETRSLATGLLSSFDVIKRETSVLETKVSREWRENHLLTYGGEYREEFIRGSRIKSGNSSYVITRDKGDGTILTTNGSEASIDYYAFYIQDEWQVNERLLVIPALRYDDSDTFEGNWSPKLGITYKMQPNSRLKVSYGQGFKTPTPTELYHDFQMYGWRGAGKPGYQFEGNPDLKPEKSRNYELGWEWERGALAGKIGLFRNDIRDLIEIYNTGRTKDTGNGTYNNIHSYRNVGRAEVEGFEAEVSKKLSNLWRFTASYAYLDAVDKDSGERLTKRPRHKIGAGLSYDEKNSGVSGSLWGSWLADYIDDLASTPQNRTYAIWNILVNKKLTESTAIYVGIDNMFNKKIDDMWINGAVYRTGIKVKF